MPIKFYIGIDVTDARNAFRIFNAWSINLPNEISYFEFVANPNGYKFHVYSSMDSTKTATLLDFSNIINRALIIHYNEEMVIPDEDVSKSLELIKTSSSKLLGKYEVCIAFPAHNDAFCAVLNSLSSNLKLEQVYFSSI